MSTRADAPRLTKELVQAAFLRALQSELIPFKLKGRCHEPRATLKPHISRFARGVNMPCATVGRRPYYPLRLVHMAALLVGASQYKLIRSANERWTFEKPNGTATFITQDGIVHEFGYRRKLAWLLEPGTRLTPINSAGRPCGETRVVGFAGSYGFTYRTGKGTKWYRAYFSEADELFLNPTETIIAVRRGNAIRSRYRIKAPFEITLHAEQPQSRYPACPGR